MTLLTYDYFYLYFLITYCINLDNYVFRQKDELNTSYLDYVITAVENPIIGYYEAALFSIHLPFK